MGYDHMALQDVIAEGTQDPVELTFLTRPTVIQEWMLEHRSKSTLGSLSENSPEEVRSDRECITIAVRRNGLELQYAISELQDEDAIVLAAVKQNGLALQYASSRLKDTEELVKAALMRNGLALQYVSPRLQNEYTIVSAAVNQN